jgi:D-alanyl-D-alanine carboxypeptidase
VIDDLRAMADAARAAGAAIAVQSAYRSYAKQKAVFAGWVAFHGYDRALQLSARPGHSEHQLGLGIDFRSDPGGSPFDGEWEKTAAGKWMKAHAWEYGFVMSYPRGKLAVACYDFEPWHFRYVGRDLAGAIHASGLTPREYLWAHFTTTVVPAVTPRPTRPPHAPASHDPTAAPATASASPSESTLPSASAAAPPTAEATLVPSAEATPAPSAEPTPAVIDPAPVIYVEAGVLAGAGIALIGLVALGWMVLRRGRSSVGL